MATSIANILVVSQPLVDNVAPLTYTATRRLRLYDLKCTFTQDPAPGAIAFTVSVAAVTAIIKVTGGAPGNTDVVRLGDNNADRRVEAARDATAGDAVAFSSDNAAQATAYLYCYPLPTR